MRLNKSATLRAAVDLRAMTVRVSSDEREFRAIVGTWNESSVGDVNYHGQVLDRSSDMTAQRCSRCGRRGLFGR